MREPVRCYKQLKGLSKEQKHQVQEYWNERQKTVVRLHNGVQHSHKKEGNHAFCDSMDRPRAYYAEWNKPVRERQVPYDFT